MVIMKDIIESSSSEIMIRNRREAEKFFRIIICDYAEQHPFASLPTFKIVYPIFLRRVGKILSRSSLQKIYNDVISMF
jgi:hypothetical protein